MKTIKDFLATLSVEERDFVEYMAKAVKHQLEGYVLLEGEPVKTTLIIALLWQTYNKDTFIVGKDMVGDIEVSTVFLTTGMRDDYHFETMTFGKNDRVVNHYKTLKEAQAGHAAVVRRLRRG
jgi:hypothetical protein